MTMPMQTSEIGGLRRLLSAAIEISTAETMTLRRFDANPESTTNLSPSIDPSPRSGAKSGAVENRPVDSGVNLDALVAFVAVLSPEQRAALAKLLGG